MKREFKRLGKFYVYIVECRDGTYYTGSTKNIEKRLELHNSGRGAKYVRGKTPVEMIYAKEYKKYKNALLAEIRLKALTRKEKEKLVRKYERRSR